MDAATFNAELRRLNSPEACSALFADAIAPLGFANFACREIGPTGGRPLFQVAHWVKGWSKAHFDLRLDVRSPVLAAAAVRRESFTWHDLIAERASPAFHDALDRVGALGIRDGFVVPVRTLGGRTGVVSMAGAEVPRNAAMRGQITLMASCLHAHLRTLCARDGFARPPFGLTAREIACLRLIAEGLSDGETGGRLGVAASTVREHMERAKARLGVASRTTLVARAASCGIIEV